MEVEQASLDKPIESVRLHLSCGTIGPAVRVDDWSREDSEPQSFLTERSFYAAHVDASSVSSALNLLESPVYVH